MQQYIYNKFKTQFLQATCILNFCIFRLVLCMHIANINKQIYNVSNNEIKVLLHFLRLTQKIMMRSKIVFKQHLTRHVIELALTLFDDERLHALLQTVRQPVGAVVHTMCIWRRQLHNLLSTRKQQQSTTNLQPSSINLLIFFTK